MARTETRSPPRLPWELRWITRFPPVATGVLASVVLVALYAVLHRALGSFPWVHDPETGLPIESNARAALILSALVGYVIAAGRLGSRAGLRARRDLGLEPEGGDPRDDERLAYAVYPGMRIRAQRLMLGVALLSLTGVGAAVALALPGAAAGLRADLLWLLGVVPIVVTLTARAIFETVLAARAVAREIDAELRVDVLDTARLHGVGQLALRGSLHWILGVAIVSLLFLSPDMITPILPVVALTLAVALPSLLLPVRGVRSKIRAAKRDELARVRAAIRGERERALAGESRGALADLVAYHDHVERISEWPFEASTYIRFALYLTIPLASWIGGAFVERGLGAWLD